MRYTWNVVLAAIVITLSGIAFSYAPVSAASYSAEVEEALKTSTYAYIASERKSGEFGTLAEIWYMYHDGFVWGWDAQNDVSGQTYSGWTNQSQSCTGQKGRTGV